MNIHHDPRSLSDNNSPTTKSFDSTLLHQVIKDAGRWAFGVIFVELWCLNENSTYLFRPEYGWWIDECAEDIFTLLTDPDLPDYLQAKPVIPGVGLTGYLWALEEPNNSNDIHYLNHKLGGNALRSLSGRVRWCDVESLANDPDQPHDPRLKFLSEAVGLAAGVPFNMDGTRGIVIYMTRKNVSVKRLKDSVNQKYLERSAVLIGSAYGLRESRLAVENQRKEDVKKCWQVLLTKIKAIKGTGITLKDIVHEESHKQTNVPIVDLTEVRKDVEGMFKELMNYFIRKFRMEAEKIFCKGIAAPPLFSNAQFFVTFIGSFITLAILTNIKVKDYASLLPTFGAFVTMQYGLTAAPAAQPRNAIIGQILSLCIAKGIGQAKILHLWFRQSIATSLAIALMVKIGVIHPPAGATALMFASGNSSWIQVMLVLMGYIIAIFCATLINNWSDKRQYPTFWGFQTIFDLLANKKNIVVEEK